MFGQESYKRYNLHYIAKDTLLFITGNAYQIFNFATNERQIFFGQDSGGIGSIAVHPSKTFFAVAEKGESPNIYIYEYPSLKLYRVLRKGTTNYYSSVDFSPSGERLASVGGDPDYQLSIWDWRQEKLLLKAKAFSQEVFKCTFSPYGDFSLITSGTGHIRFWKIAQTFTGLKLQSEIGKFGQLELSDVSAFAELVSGLVLCGTEYGTLLLWDGNLVKAHIVAAEGVPLHKGMIEQIIIKDPYVVTAGSDGFIRWFDLNTIANTEPDETLTLEVKHVYQLEIKSEHGVPAYIVSILQGPDHWVVADGRGKMWRLDTETKEYVEVMHFHAGRINDLVLPAETNAAVSLGSDGVIKLWDFVKNVEVYTRRFEGEGLCMDWMPASDKNQGRVIAAGFTGGVVRVLLLGPQKFQLLAAFKALDSDVVKVGYSWDGKHLVAAGADGSLFFFDVLDLQDYRPVCLAELKQKVNDLRWNADNKRVLVGCETGNVVEVTRAERGTLDTKASYLVELPLRTWTIKIMEMQMKKNQQQNESEEEKRRRRLLMYTAKNPQELKEEEEQEWDPAPILTCMYYNENADEFLVTADKEYRGYIYFCSFECMRPVKGIEYGYKTAQCLSMNIYPTEDTLSIGLSNGRYQIRSMSNLEKYVEVNAHDNYGGKLKKVLVNSHKSYSLSTGDDGLIFVYGFNAAAFNSLLKYYEEREQEDVREEDIAKILEENVLEPDKEDVGKLNLEGAIALTGEVDVDIDPSNVLSLQVAKLKSEEDAKEKMALSKKERTRMEVEQLRQEYEKIVKKHLDRRVEGSIRDFDEVTNVDCEYFDTLAQELQKQIDEINKELEYDKERHKVAVQKIKEQYFDPLEYGIVTIKGIKSEAFARTFRLTKLAEFVERNLKEQEDLIRAENEKKERRDSSDDSMEGSVKGAAAADTHAVAKAKANPFQLDKTKEKKVKKSTVEVNQEKRRQDRLRKREEKEEIKRMEPKDEDDPEYKEKMDAITANKGDKKLKSDPDYNVPEEQRRDANKQRYEMLLLTRGLYNIQKNHNEKILELRDRKSAIVKKFERINQRIKEINKVLGVGEELFQPQIHEELEYPEKYYEVHDDDLISHLQRLKAREDEKKERRDSEDAEQREENYYDSYLIPPPKDAAELRSDDEVRLPPERKDYVRDKSPLENEQEKIREIELLYEKQTLKEELEKEVKEFDTEIETLQHAKMKSESDKKYGEMKLIIGFEALLMLKGLVDRDVELTERLGKFKEEKLEIAKQFNEIAKAMNEKEVVMNNLKEEKEQIIARFDELIPLNHPARQLLHSFFERKIKRKAKKDEERL